MADLRTLALCVLLVPAVWLLLLGWDGAALLGGNDAFGPMLLLRELLEVNGRWWELTHLPEIYGGSISYAGKPEFVFYPLWAWLGIPAVLAYNLTHFTIQVLFAFLGVRISRDFALWWSEPDTGSVPSVPWLLEASAVVLFAFAPFMAWRLGWGHQGLVAGVLTFVAVLALCAAARVNHYTVTFLFLAVLGVIAGVSSYGVQLTFYGTFFGAPIAVAVLKPWGPGGARRFWVTASLAGGAALIALPLLWQMLQYGTSPDAARSIDGQSMTYSYTTATWSDWLGAIPWSRGVVEESRDPFHLHETNYPLGPVLLLLFLVPWKRCKSFGVVLAVTLVIAVCFTMNVYPVSDWLRAIVPPLDIFRVPARVMMLFCSLLLMLAVGGVVFRQWSSDRAAPGWLTVLLAVCAATAAFVGPPVSRELIALTATAALVVAWTRTVPVTWSRLAAPGLVLSVLAFASVAAFEQRLLPFSSRESTETTPLAVKHSIEERQTPLGRPLTRAVFTDLPQPFTVNSGWAFGVSTFDGYAVPPSRILHLVTNLEGAEYDPGRGWIHVRRQAAGFRVLRHLYNICCQIEVRGTEADVQVLQPTLGAAWFSDHVRFAPSQRLMLQELRSKANLGDSLRNTMHVVRDGGFVADSSMLGRLRDCADARVTAVEEGRSRGELVRIHYRSDHPCALTVALTYRSQLRASIEIEDGSRYPATLFPSYGAVTGVVVRKTKGVLSITAPDLRPRWIGWLYLLGGVPVLIGGAVALRSRKQR